MSETDRELVDRVVAEAMRAGFPAEPECPNCGIRGDDVIDLVRTTAFFPLRETSRGCECGLCGHEWPVESEEAADD